MKIEISLIFFALLCNAVIAQELELFSIHSAYYPNQEVKGGMIEGEVGYTELGVQLTIPQILNDNKTIISHTLQYGHLITETKINVNNTLNENITNYHTITYRLNLNQKISDKWRLNIGLSPTLASDFEKGLSNNDLLIQANCIAMRFKNRNFNYGLGIAFSTRFGRELLLPMALLNHNTAKRTINVALPNRVSIMFNTENKNFYYGLQAILNGALFNIHTNNSSTNNIIDRVGYSRLNLGAGIEFRLKGATFLRTSAGLSLARKLEFIDTNNEIIDRTPQNGPFFNLGIVYYPQRKVNNVTEDSR